MWMDVRCNSDEVFAEGWNFQYRIPMHLLPCFFEFFEFVDLHRPIEG